MAILNGFNNEYNYNSEAKYCLVQPIVIGRYGKVKLLKSRITHNVQIFNPSWIDNNILEYYDTFCDVIIALCLLGRMYSARINPSGFELRGVCPKHMQHAKTIDFKNIKIIACSTAKAKNPKHFEFLIDETMFDSYLETKPIINPDYVYKEDHWIIQILKGTWDNTEIVDSSVSSVKNIPLEATIIEDEGVKPFSIEILSTKIFGHYQPCYINAISPSQGKNLVLDIQIIQYDDIGQPRYIYIPVANSQLSNEELEYLVNLRLFLAQNDKNCIAINNNSISQIEFIQTLDIIDDDVNSESVNDGDKIMPIVHAVSDEVIIDFKNNFDEINYTVQTRNDMALKYFDQYQPCVLTSINFSNVTGNLYGVNLLRHNQDGNPESLNILIPTCIVQEKDRNFFNEFQNNLRKNKFIRIVNSTISFVDEDSTSFIDDYIVQNPIVTIEPLIDDSYHLSIIDDYEDTEIETIWTTATLIFNKVVPIDDEYNIELEPMPKTKEQKKEQARLFFYNTFKDTSIDQEYSFAIQNNGTTVALLYDSPDKPIGRKVLYGSKIEDFDVDIQQVIKDCIEKKITFFNENSKLVGKVFCPKTNSIKTKVFLSLQ